MPVAFWMVSTAWLTAMFASVTQSRPPNAQLFRMSGGHDAGLKLTPRLRINAAEMASNTAAMAAASESRKRRPLSRRLCRWL